MAILKHSTSKNSSYNDVLEYYTQKHKEDEKTGHYELILDSDGLPMERENYAIACLDPYGSDADPEKWADSCVATNIAFRKNLGYRDRKIHQYIISHPAEDRAKMTMEDLLDEGKAFAREYLKGYDVLLAVHRDTDNDHIHISINSVRAVSREERGWMMKDEFGETLRCEMAAGGKHQDSPTLMHDCQEWLYRYSIAHGYKPEDNNKRSAEKKRERTSERYENLRKILLSAAADSRDMDCLIRLLEKTYQIKMFIRGKTISIQPEESPKPIRLKTLGIESEELYRALNLGRNTKSGFETPQTEQEQRREAEHRYIQWLKLRRGKNAQKAEDTIAVSQAIIQDKLHSIGMQYTKWDFRELDYLIQKTTYLERDLITEADKLDALIERWQLYRNKSLPQRDRARHGNYIRWCGCEPDEQIEFADLLNEREILRLEIEHVVATRNSLIETADKWKGKNDIVWAEKNLCWTISRKDQLQKQLETCRFSRKKLEQIAFNCQKAAMHRMDSKAYQEKADRFYKLRAEKIRQEKEIKEQLRKLKQQEHSARKQVEAEKRKGRTL